MSAPESQPRHSAGRNPVPTFCLTVRTVADPGSLPRVLEVFAKRGMVPSKLFSVATGADELTVSAANALLKTLEEPPPRTFFILITSRPSRLLDTIRSRTLPVRFGPLPESTVTSLLQARGLDPKLAPLAHGPAGARVIPPGSMRRCGGGGFPSRRAPRARRASTCPVL